jgi:hypothetical protein
MTISRRGLGLLGAQVLLGLLVVGRFALDRSTLPRVWARTVPVDPTDPLRGRYVRLWLDAEDHRGAGDSAAAVEFYVRDGVLAARPATGWRGLRVREPSPPDAAGVVVREPVAYFIPEHVADPAVLAPGQTLWVEVSVPRRGLPRPIRIEVRSNAP